MVGRKTEDLEVEDFHLPPNMSGMEKLQMG
jgi:hypothetical protein